MRVNDDNFLEDWQQYNLEQKRRIRIGSRLCFLEYFQSYHSCLIQLNFIIPQKIKILGNGAHIPKNIYRKEGLTTHLDGVLILGKDSSPEYLIELLGIKKLLVKKGYKEAKLLKSIKDISNQSLSQKLRLWGIAY